MADNVDPPFPVAEGRNESLGLVTDMYQLRMAASYLDRQMTAPATFSLFVRRLPRDRRFLVAAGLDDTLAAIEQSRLQHNQLDWLVEQGLLDRRRCDLLAGLRFTGDVWAVPEGTVVFPEEPILEVTAPLPEAQLVESVVLNQITYQTAIATKATRCRLAADGRADLIDFALRRTHGIEAGLAVARAAAIAGFAGTSNVEAARRFGIPAVGTMAHSYIEAFDDERSAFAAFAADFPEHAVLLVDTYDTLTGVDRAIEVIDEMTEATGRSLRFGVRLDSGDLEHLARATRRRLDDAGHHDATIVASSSLDEWEIARLLAARAPIDVFGVGTRMGVSADAPSLDSAYKLVSYDGRPVMKLSPGKETKPGPTQVHRHLDEAIDRLATRTEPVPHDALGLLEPVMVDGRRVGGVSRPAAEQLVAARRRLHVGLADLPPRLRELGPAAPYPVEMTPTLADLTATVRSRVPALSTPAT